MNRIRYQYYYLLALIVVVLDQITKYGARIGMFDRWHDNFLLSCQITMNRGISWGMLHTDNTWLFIMVSFFIACITTCIGWYTYQRMREGKQIIGNVLVLAGSYSNLIDRVIQGGVTDFILCSYQSFSWPIFNIADIAIVVGVLLMIFIGDTK